MVEEQEQEEVKSIKSSSAQKFVRIISVVVFLAIITTLIIIANLSESFSLAPAIWIGLGFFVLFALVFFSFNIKHLIQRFKEKEKETKLPKAITEQQAFELIENKFKTKHYADYIDGPPMEGGAEIRGKAPLTQWIYTLYFKTLYSQQKYFCGLNMHYPELGIKILLNPKPNQMLTAKKRLATEPEEAPDIEEISTFSPSLGLSTIQKKFTHKRKEKSKTEQTGDLK